MSRRAKNNSDIAENVLKAQIADELHDGKLKNTVIEIELAERMPQMEAMPGMAIDLNLGEMLGKPRQSYSAKEKAPQSFRRGSCRAVYGRRKRAAFGYGRYQSGGH